MNKTSLTYDVAKQAAEYRLIAIVHYTDGSHKEITLPRCYDTQDKALLAGVVMTVNDQQQEAYHLAQRAKGLA